MEKDEYVGDEFVEDEEEEEAENELEGLYDLIIPPGVPQSLIVEVADKFGLEIEKRPYNVKTIDMEVQNLLVLRGELDAVNEAHDYMYGKLKEKYGEIA